ncbi:MAG TPA: PIG-L deacetylase family protein [Dehalococcoidales bacterium]|nr:PIG-L deacetylase family protein [Dehalococcoidales bacterium]
MMVEQTDLLVIAPHADDSEFGIAGTVAKMTRQGKKVVYLICTNGDKGTSDLNLDPHELIQIRAREQREAAAVLGVAEVVFLGYADQGLEDTAEFRKEIVRQIRIFQPHTVATTDPYRKYLQHRDHRICGQVVLDAIYPFSRDHLSFPDLLEQGFQPHRVKEVLTWGTDEPNYWMDISDSFEIKIEALRKHVSQVGKRDNVQFYNFLKERARQAGLAKGFALAEEFHRLEILR